MSLAAGEADGVQQLTPPPSAGWTQTRFSSPAADHARPPLPPLMSASYSVCRVPSSAITTTAPTPGGRISTNAIRFPLGDRRGKRTRWDLLYSCLPIGTRSLRWVSARDKQRETVRCPIGVRHLFQELARRPTAKRHLQERGVPQKGQFVGRRERQELDVLQAKRTGLRTSDFRGKDLGGFAVPLGVVDDGLPVGREPGAVLKPIAVRHAGPDGRRSGRARPRQEAIAPTLTPRRRTRYSHGEREQPQREHATRPRTSAA